MSHPVHSKFSIFFRRAQASFLKKLFYFGMNNFKFRTFISFWPPEKASQMVEPGGAQRFGVVDFIKIHLRMKISPRLIWEQTTMNELI